MSDIAKKHKPDETDESRNDILPYSPLELVLSCVRDFKLPEAFCSPNLANSADHGKPDLPQPEHFNRRRFWKSSFTMLILSSLAFHEARVI